MESNPLNVKYRQQKNAYVYKDDVHHNIAHGVGQVYARGVVSSMRWVSSVGCGSTGLIC